MGTEASFYGLEPRWRLRNRLFKVFAGPDALYGAWVPGQFCGEEPFAVTTPGSPEFLAADTRNFILRRETSAGPSSRAGPAA